MELRGILLHKGLGRTSKEVFGRRRRRRELLLLSLHSSFSKQEEEEEGDSHSDLRGGALQKKRSQLERKGIRARALLCPGWGRALQYK